MLYYFELQFSSGVLKTPVYAERGHFAKHGVDRYPYVSICVLVSWSDIRCVEAEHFYTC